MKHPLLPLTLDGDTFGSVPIATRQVYEYQEGRGVYRLTIGGTVLNQVRQALGEGTASGLRVSATVSVPDWTKTLSAATTAERKELLKLRAANYVRMAK